MKNPVFPIVSLLVAAFCGLLPKPLLFAQIYGEPRYGYQPQVAAPPYAPDVMQGVAMGSGEERFFLDRFGRHFKIYRARPYNPGSDGNWTGGRDDVPAIAPAGTDPLSALKTPGGSGIERARPFSPADNRYPLAGSPEPMPDLSRYPQPPQDRVLKNEPLLRRTEPSLTPVPRSQWPAPAPRPESPGTGGVERTSPSILQEAPLKSWEKPALPREQMPGVPAGQSAPAPRDEPAGTAPGKQTAATPPEDPLAKLPYGVPVKGKKGFVRLEAHPNLPEIDVRGIAPGTPVEFPDPRDPSQIIQFRVPKSE